MNEIDELKRRLGLKRSRTDVTPALDVNDLHNRISVLEEQNKLMRAALKIIDGYEWALGDADPKTMARQERIEMKADAFGDVVSIARRCLDKVG